MNRDEKIVRVFKELYKERQSTEPSGLFERRVMADVRIAAAASEPAEDRFSTMLFMRLSFASLVLALLVNASYGFGSVGEQIALDNLVQIDPFEIGGDLDE